jgi:hypothetical protein
LAVGATAAADEAKDRGSSKPLSKEILDFWTPGGDTNDPRLPYPHITAPFQKETDDNWRDDRWQQTVKGPFVSHSILLPDYEVGPKLTAIDAGRGTFLLFDLESGSFVAATSAGELKIDPARFGLLNRPLLTGNVAFHVSPGHVWRKRSPSDHVENDAVDYQGLYLHNNRVLLTTIVDGAEVLESALLGEETGVVIREIEVAPHVRGMWMCIAEGSGIELLADAQRVTWRDRTGNAHTVILDSASADICFEQHESSVLLHLPDSNKPLAARLRYWSGNAIPVSTLAAVLPELAPLKMPGGRRWGGPLPTRGGLAPESELPYVVDHIPPPRDNPFHALFFLAGLDFFSNGDAAVCTVHGDVWIVRGLDADLQQVTWQRFASGLYQPLGLEIVDGKVVVLGRDQLTRLHDMNNDGEADFYESFNHDLVILGQPHAFVMRLERTPDGSFLFLKSGDGPHGSSLLQLSPDGARLEVLARGFRHPFGMGAGPNGEITAADNEGNWVPSSKIDLVTRGGFYGYHGAATDPTTVAPALRPLCYIPKIADNSSGGQFWHTSQQWGPYHRGGMFHFSWGRCTLHSVLEQQVDDVRQAASVEIPGVILQSGPGEAEFSPRDGQLYVVGLDGWQTAATVDGTLERVRYTGNPMHLPSSFAAYDDGIELGFDEPLERSSLEQRGAVDVQQWNYKRSATYGSYHYSLKDPDHVGHDRVDVKKAILSPDRKRLILKITNLRPVDQIQVSLALATADGKPLKANVYGTINAVAKRDADDTAVTGTDQIDNAMGQVLSSENIVAWCIVPFDAKKRSPAERAVMLKKLGIKRVAYDWRDEHVPQFDEELEEYKRNGIALHAFWMPVNTELPLNERHWPIVLDLVKRHEVQPQLWVMLSDELVSSLAAETRTDKGAEILTTAARAADERGCRIGLYNHGGWFGEPENQIAIIEAMRKQGIDNVGIVYNFHHGHEHMGKFPDLAKKMSPYLISVNVNGMRAGGPKILSFGDGDENGAAERNMLKSLVAAGYSGPIGILGHREERDVEECLREGLQGIKQK